ncbi:MAG: hypothetical protein ACRDG4_16460, partial [Chloroflexota bacterium]
IAHVLLRWSAASGRERLVHELSTHLFACAAALRDSTGVPLPTVSQLVYRPDLQRLQTSLGTERFEAAWSAGWEMPVLPLVERILVRQGAGEPSLPVHAKSDVINLTPLLLLGPESNN